MLRELQTIGGKNATAMFTADVAMVQGMVVVKSGTEAVLPTAGATDLFFVTKARIPTGLLSIQGELSDYNSAFETINAGDPVILTKYFAGEAISVDQITGTPTAGTYLIAGIDGKLTAQTAGTTSNIVYRGAYDDAGHALSKIEFVEPLTVA